MQSGEQFHSWQSERNSGGTPGSRYDDLLYDGPQNIPSYHNDLSAGAWEGERSPSIILKINPTLYSFAESINNVSRGAKIDSDIVTFIH